MKSIREALHKGSYPGKRQLEQKANQIWLESWGIKTWRIFKTRNQCAELLWLACNRLSPDNPHKAYRALEEALRRNIDNGVKIDLRLAKYVGDKAG